MVPTDLILNLRNRENIYLWNGCRLLGCFDYNLLNISLTETFCGKKHEETYVTGHGALYARMVWGKKY